MRWALLVFCLIAGCSGGKQDAASLVIWHAYRGDEADALARSAVAFEAANPGAKVRLVAIPYDAFANKISVAVPRGNGPDLFIFAHDRIGDWAASGLIEPLGFWARAPQLERFLSATIDPLIYDGQLFALPLAFKTLALFYDTTLIDQPPATTDAMVAQAKRAAAKHPGVRGLGYPIDDLYFHAVWMHGFGGAIYKGTTDTLALSSPEVARSARFVRRLVEEGVIPDEITSALVTTLFRQHKLAFVINGPWFKGELKGHTDWAVAPLPVVSETGLPARPFLGVEALLMSSRSSKKALGWAFMQHITNAAQSKLRFEIGGQLVATESVYASANDSFAAVFGRQALQTVPLSNRPHMRRVWTPVKNALNSALIQGRDPAESFAEAVRVIQAKGE